MPKNAQRTNPPPDQKPSRPGESLLAQLSSAAASIHRSIRSESELLQTCRTETAKLGLYGLVCLLAGAGHQISEIIILFPTQAADSPGKLKCDHLTLNHFSSLRQVVKQRAAIFVTDNSTVTSQLYEKTSVSSTEPHFRAFSDLPTVYAPLIIQEQVVGILGLAGSRMTVEALPAISTFAAHVAVALENARLLAKKSAIMEADRQVLARLRQEISDHTQTQKTLARSERFNRALLEASPIGILYLDATGRVIYENPAMQQMMHPSQVPVSWLGQHISELPPVKGAGALPLIGQVLAGETAIAEVIQYRNAGGAEVSLEIYGAPLVDTQGQWEGAILMGHDVTQRRQAEQMRDTAYRISEAAQTAPDLKELFDSIRRIICKIMGTDDFYIALYDEARDTLSFPYFLDEHDSMTPRPVGKGLTEYVLRTGQPLLATPEIFAELVKTEGIEGIGTPAVDWLGIPLKTASRIIGVLAVQSYSYDIRLKEEDKDILEFVSTQVAMAIERKQNEEKIHRRNRELALLNQIIAASAADVEPKHILETVCRELAATFDVSQATGALLSQDKETRTVIAEQMPEGWPSALNKALPIKNDPAYQYLLQNKAPLVINDTETDPRIAPQKEILHQQKIASLVLVPLIIDDEVIGSLGLGHHEPRRFSAQEISLAWSVGDQVAGALARAELVQAQQRMITAIDQAVESVVITDTEGTILYTNPAFEQTTGYSRSEAVGQNPSILKSHQHDASFYEELWNTITGGKVWHGRLINKKKDGTLFTEDATISPVRDEDGNIVNFVAVKRDVTRELELEEQYLQAQKMEAIGQLTGGIAHDFNNLLTAINGFAELLQMQLSPDDRRYEMVDKIMYSGQRAASLVRQLLAFSRKQIIEPEILDLNVVVSEMSKMLQRIIGENIRMETKLASESCLIKIDPAQIEQIILNLAVNARDAMPEGGLLIIATENVFLDETFVANHLDAQPGEHVLLSVSDTGVGMDHETQVHIFEPFFTTKEEGKGTGLGLATVFGIAKQNGGTIWVYSEVGQGTTFKIYLPRTEQDKSFRAQLPDEVELPAGTETILLVEDDPEMQDLIYRILDRQGYTLLSAQNSEDALNLSQGYAEPIDLLLTDIILPDVSGPALAERVVQQRPELKVLFISGYTEEIIAHHGVLDSGVAFLQKPFSPGALAQKVRMALDTPPRQ